MKIVRDLKQIPKNLKYFQSLWVMFSYFIWKRNKEPNVASRDNDDDTPYPRPRRMSCHLCAPTLVSVSTHQFGTVDMMYAVRFCLSVS